MDSGNVSQCLRLEKCDTIDAIVKMFGWLFGGGINCILKNHINISKIWDLLFLSLPSEQCTHNPTTLKKSFSFQVLLQWPHRQQRVQSWWSGGRHSSGQIAFTSIGPAAPTKLYAPGKEIENWKFKLEQFSSYRFLFALEKVLIELHQMLISCRGRSREP